LFSKFARFDDDILIAETRRETMSRNALYFSAHVELPHILSIFMQSLSGWKERRSTGRYWRLVQIPADERQTALRLASDRLSASASGSNS
jgi:hypothetical protein